MRVLVDRHHAGLLHSLQLLFEDRFGLELYVPVGHDWWDQGYWRFGQVFGDDRLAQQYLAPNHLWHASPTGFQQLITFDPDYPERLVRGVSLQGFRELDGWRYVVATVQENQAGFHRLAEEVGATSVYQVGNTRQYIDWSLDQRVLLSNEAEIPDGKRALRYHQEFDKNGVFGFQEPEIAWRNQIGSFVNLLEKMPEQWDRFTAAEAVMPEFLFRVHGHEGRDGGYMQPASLVAKAMGGYLFGWHDKPQGDGFGHVIHAWAAVGRPLIGTASYYDGRLAQPLWDDLVTCIDLGRRPMGDVVALIREIAADPDRHAQMCRAIRERLDELCDFDTEAAQIAALLEI